MKTIIPYLFFEKECRAAMSFYSACLGGELVLLPLGDSAAAGQVPPEKKDLIMHASLTNGNVALFAADNCMGRPLEKGKRSALAIQCSSEEELNALYTKLVAGGTPTLTPRVEAWGDTFGMLTDKFDVDWMLSYRKE